MSIDFFAFVFDTIDQTSYDLIIKIKQMNIEFFDNLCCILPVFLSSASLPSIELSEFAFISSLNKNLKTGI